LKGTARIPHKLAVVGPPGWLNGSVHQTVSDLQLSGDVMFTGFVDDDTLNRLYNNAELLVYPSLYEGFGLPPLEAMAAGCPVAVSRASSLPEVVGDAGVYFDPVRVEDIARAIHEVLDSPGLREKLVKQGLERSRRYSWEEAAAHACKVYGVAREIRGKGHR
jgi:glycosyltransferase involved in cell wall biosynthesis